MHMHSFTTGDGSRAGRQAEREAAPPEKKKKKNRSSPGTRWKRTRRAVGYAGDGILYSTYVYPAWGPAVRPVACGCGRARAAAACSWLLFVSLLECSGPYAMATARRQLVAVCVPTRRPAGVASVDHTYTSRSPPGRSSCCPRARLHRHRHRARPPGTPDPCAQVGRRTCSVRPSVRLVQ